MRRTSGEKIPQSQKQAGWTFRVGDKRIRLLFLERDYFLLREGLRDLRNIVGNVETHYGRILGGDEIREKINHLLTLTGDRSYEEAREREDRAPKTTEEPATTTLADLMNDGRPYGG
jgi:hypothetical protein